MTGPGSSTVAGFIQPTSTPLLGQNLARFLQQLVVGITGLPGALVQPRWQQEQATIPDAGTAWAAIGVNWAEPLGTSFQGIQPDGTYLVQQMEHMHAMVSFYDTGITQQANLYCTMLREGLQLGQNRDILNSNGFGFMSCGPMTPVPALVKQRWLFRLDMEMRFLRTLNWTYPVTNIQTVQLQAQSQNLDGSLKTFTFSVPPGV